MAPPADDDALVRAAQSGDRAALETLLRDHHDRIYAICRRLAGNEADALDATQEALLAIVRGLDRFDGRARFTTWSYRVATNACLDELRRRQRRPRPGLPEDGTGPAPEDPAAGAAIEAVSERAALDEALADLSPDFRAAVVLRDLCDLDYQEIADALGIPPGTVRSRIARARGQLAAALTPGNQPPPGRRLRRGTGATP